VASALLSSLHLLALALGLPAVFFRGRALKAQLDASGLKRLFAADAVWGLAAVLWLGTGLTRAFGPFEKGTQFYLHSALFHTKLTLFVLVLLLEVWPMLTFIRWRIQIKKGQTPNVARARALYVVNHVQMVLVVAIVFVASFMARGFSVFA
jgi:putative membrane protein